MSKKAQHEEEDWSNPPSDLLENILECTKPDRIDVLRFRSVCAFWRSTIPRFPSSPLTLPLPIPDPLPVSLFSPSVDQEALAKRFIGRGIVQESTIYLLENPRNRNEGFLVQVVAEGEEANCTRLVTPLNRSRLDEAIFPKELSLLDFHVSRISTSHAMKTYIFDHPSDEIPGSRPSFRKLVILGNVDTGYAVYGKYGLGTGYVTLCFLRGGDEQWSWVRADLFNRLFSLDFTTYKGKFCLVTGNGSAIAFNSLDNISDISSPIDGFESDHEAFLVESLGDLYLFDIFHWPESKFSVYKLDEEEGQWIETTNLGADRVFFVSPDYSFSISTRVLVGFKGNRMYKSQSYLKGYENNHISTTLYDLEDGSIQELHGHPLWSRSPMHPAADCNPDPHFEEDEDEGWMEELLGNDKLTLEENDGEGTPAIGDP